MRIPAVDLDIQLAAAGQPGTARRPGLAVVSEAEFEAYWIIDLGAPVTMLACQLAGGFGHRDGGAVRGVRTGSWQRPTVHPRLIALLEAAG